MEVGDNDREIDGGREDDRGEEEEAESRLSTSQEEEEEREEGGETEEGGVRVGDRESARDGGVGGEVVEVEEIEVKGGRGPPYV